MSTDLYEKAELAFRKISEQSEGFRALTEAQETWKACLPPHISELTRASQHFNSQLESIRKLAGDQFGVHKLALVAFQNSLKAASTLPPNIWLCLKPRQNSISSSKPLVKS
jgi:hypothetical protein